MATESLAELAHNGGVFTKALSPREVRVLELKGAGLTNKEIGERMNISEHTVAAFLRRIFFKLSVKNSAQAVTAHFQQFAFEVPITIIQPKPLKRAA